MARKSLAFRARSCAAPLLAAVAALSACDHPADEVEPTPPPLELQLPLELPLPQEPGPPLIEPAPLPPTDPSIPAPPDPGAPASPSPDPPKAPATDTATTAAIGDRFG